ncbi:hypothetical protein ACFSO7_20980 [Bacillus sp. CGMCC 1.16607]|uniref:hypothetical protein n=1 Tax=Bacillus sp. CGMCC 1.16607 TaxID=3351842 RepID=UPI00362FA38A
MRFSLLILLSIFLMVGCSASLEEKQDETIKAVQDQLKKKPKETNKEVGEIEFYLPFGFEIEKESPNNLILKNGSKTYILFYNQHENEQSDVVYKSTLNQHEEFEINKKWKEKESLGYLLVEKVEKDKNELIVGIGGVKLTSETKTSSLATEAATMMEIVHSVAIKMKQE